MSERDHLREQEVVPWQVTNAVVERHEGNPRESVHEISNYYIRIATPRRDLPVFIIWPHFVGISVVLLVASAFMFLIGLRGGNCRYAPLVALVVSVLYIIVLNQHDYVVRNSFPVVWKQPGFEETSKYAVDIMKKAKFRSRLLMGCYVFSLFYNGFWTIFAFTAT